MARIIVAEACGSPIGKSLKTLAEVHLTPCGDTPRKSLKYNKVAAEVCTPSITYYAAPALGGRQRGLKESPK